MTIVGVPGIGKSRLVRELGPLGDAGVDALTWREGRCLPYGERVTFWALGEIVKAEAGILESDTPAEAERKLRDAVANLVPEAGERRWIETELRALVGVSGDGTAGSNAETATAAWRRFLEAIAARRPTVLLFEDLHWADDGLLDFVDDLVDWVADVPLLIAGTARPELLERRQAWGGGKSNATTISLQPLSEQDTDRLISTLLPRPLLPADERQALLERAGGNPLFAEQYVRMLSERGTTAELPESVQGVIAARIDALPRPEKELLQEAAVQGKVFWLGGVAEAIGAPATDVDRLLRALERKDFVRRERGSTVGGDTQYTFRHVLLRDVAYGQLPRRARSEKHRRAAAWIEGLGRTDDHAELLAHHFKRALELERAAGLPVDPDLVERAREALRAAGERALALSAYGSAAERFADALALAGDAALRPRLLLLRARAIFALGGAGLDLLTQALEGFRAAGDVEGFAEAATIAARFSWHAGDRSATDRFIADALLAVGERSATRARAEALTAQAGFHMLGGSFEDSIRVGGDALPLVEALGMEEQRARLHVVVGCARCCLGDAGGLDEIESGIATADAAGAVESLVGGWANLSSELHFFGRLDEARHAWRCELELSERYGLGRHLRGARASGVGWSLLDGRWDDAVTVADELVATAEADGRDYFDPIVLAQRAWIRLGRDDLGGAERDSERAVAIARASDLQAIAAAFPIRASVMLAVGGTNEAEALASELATIGEPLIPALCGPFPTLAEVAWLFEELGRGRELVEVMLDRDPIRSPWNDAARAICEGEPDRAARVIDGIGHTAAGAYAWLRAAEARGVDADSEARMAQADGFYRTAAASRFLSDVRLGQTHDRPAYRAP